MYHVQMLGGLNIHGPRGPVGDRLPQRRPLAVLGALAAARAKGLSRAKLIGMIWPDDDETRARHHLSDALTSIRHSLGHAAIHADGEMLYINEAEVRCDVALFEDALAEGRLEDAVAVYQGPLLDGFYVPGAGELEEATGRQRRRLADAYAAALERLAHAASESGHHRSASDWLRRLVAHDPYSTRVVLKLVAELEEAGDGPGALIAAEEHERRLRAELDVEPDTALRAVLHRLRAPAGPPPLAPVQPNRAPVPPTSFARSTSAPSAPPRRAHTLARLGRLRRPGRVLGVSGVASFAMISLAGALLLGSPRRALPPERWIVLPFETLGADSAVARLAADLPFYVDMLLAGRAGPQVHDRAGTLERWRRARGRTGDGISEHDALRVAEDAGGGRLLLGMLARIGDRVDVVLRLLEVPSGAQRAMQTGSATFDSTATLIERLLRAVEAQDAGPTAAAIAAGAERPPRTGSPPRPD